MDVVFVYLPQRLIPLLSNLDARNGEIVCQTATQARLFAGRSTGVGLATTLRTVLKRTAEVL